MGNNQTQNEAITSHVIYGEPKSLVNNNGQKTHIVPFPVVDEQEGKRFMNHLSVTQNFSKKHLLMSDGFTTQSVFLCTKSKIVNCTFPFFPFNLEQQIQGRCQTNSFLTKQQLINLIYQIIDGAGNFDQIEEKVGDIRPGQILLSQNKRSVKLINYFTAPNQLTGLQKAVDLKEKVFLAPQQLKALQKNNPTPQINVHKADSFSLGLTILAIGNLKQFHDDIYDLKGFSFSWTQLNSELEAFENRYGHFLAQIVKGFVQNQPRNRLYIGEVGAILQFYRKQILEMLDFQPDFALLQKTYELNYSGPRSQSFKKWLFTCRQHYKTSHIHRQTVLLPPALVSSPTKVNNSKVKFYYTSPSVIKNAS